jgi:hypothetical protein
VVPVLGFNYSHLQNEDKESLAEFLLPNQDSSDGHTFNQIDHMLVQQKTGKIYNKETQHMQMI